MKTTLKQTRFSDLQLLNHLNNKTKFDYIFGISFEFQEIMCKYFWFDDAILKS